MDTIWMALSVGGAAGREMKTTAKTGRRCYAGRRRLQKEMDQGTLLHLRLPSDRRQCYWEAEVELAADRQKMELHESKLKPGPLELGSKPPFEAFDLTIEGCNGHLHRRAFAQWWTLHPSAA